MTCGHRAKSSHERSVGSSVQLTYLHSGILHLIMSYSQEGMDSNTRPRRLMQILTLYFHKQQLNQNSGKFQSVKYCKKRAGGHWRIAFSL